MGLATLKAEGPPRAPRTACAIGVWLASLSDTDRADAEALIADEAWPTLTLHKALRADPDIQGYGAGSEKPLASHRKHECLCVR